MWGEKEGVDVGDKRVILKHIWHLGMLLEATAQCHTFLPRDAMPSRGVRPDGDHL